MNAEENCRGPVNIMKNTQECKVDTASVQGAPKAVRVGIPGNDDVLLGRGRLSREHVVSYPVCLIRNYCCLWDLIFTSCAVGWAYTCNLE